MVLSMSFIYVASLQNRLAVFSPQEQSAPDVRRSPRQPGSRLHLCCFAPNRSNSSARIQNRDALVIAGPLPFAKLVGENPEREGAVVATAAPLKVFDYVANAPHRLSVSPTQRSILRLMQAARRAGRARMLIASVAARPLSASRERQCSTACFTCRVTWVHARPASRYNGRSSESSY